MDTDTNDTSSLYPPPPPYYNFFTPENIKNLKEYKKQKKESSIKKNNDSDDNSNIQQTRTNNADDEVITSELDFLIPPPIPASKQYRGFGNIWQLNDELPDLESMGIRQLYSNENLDKNNHTTSSTTDGKTVYQNKIAELHKLLKSLLLNYLELVGILSINPTQFEAKLEHIKTILINIHHLLNQYRPHQSRESLIMLLEGQLEYKKKEIKNIEDVCDQVKAKLKSITEELSKS
ncbi:hypothetical protein TBLA_0B08720 [Henningerozyma blattae CBS 6284]|uniref:Mediator of RNA polymerase II transcription subunit 7 n=1 Tax=Henningerozyma blattae (strain ATCC 34711 / CBS 6284 / DSM 70876 / NBRC 10599 / NRRL Y-10934 / UCD 77-7) TaxID=1071380 RepID=I2GZY5_HENB6|nr:hypothetical protein TBLA_0B08720 [Tetrapisispora blattae CBS 6284]CCH59687.1 hypothetical protein TBLA_0B08720 [Tetrapisispora blattae CBS 6284]